MGVITKWVGILFVLSVLYAMMDYGLVRQANPYTTGDSLGANGSVLLYNPMNATQNPNYDASGMHGILTVFAVPFQAQTRDLFAIMAVASTAILIAATFLPIISGLGGGAAFLLPYIITAGLAGVVIGGIPFLSSIIGLVGFPPFISEPMSLIISFILFMGVLAFGLGREI